MIRYSGKDGEVRRTSSSEGRTRPGVQGKTGKGTKVLPPRHRAGSSQASNAVLRQLIKGTGGAGRGL